MIQSPKVAYQGDGTPNFIIAPTLERVRLKKLDGSVTRAEKLLDILQFKLKVSDPGEKNGWDLRHSWDYWEDNEKDAYWEGAFAAGKLAHVVSSRGPNQEEWPPFLRQWVKDERAYRF